MLFKIFYTTMILPIISNEQYNIIKQLKNNNNVIVDSVAGCGKTTSNLHIAKEFYDKNILLLTYNAKLKIETREKVKELNLYNLETHSYHSFCVKYYNYKCYTDSTITNILHQKTPPLRDFHYDIIILDEAQDLTPLYFELVIKIFKDNALTENNDNASLENNDNASLEEEDNNNPKETKLCLLGDQYQSIYQFNKADERFIIFAEKIFKLNKYNWAKCKLNYSFRITTEMCDFLNHCMLNQHRISAYKKSNCKPRYLICNTFQYIGNSIFDEIRYYLKMGYHYDDIFILAPSVKTKGTNASPVRILENKIKMELSHIPIYIPSSDDEKIDEEIVKNKLLFLTFHQAKGLERKVIIVFNFDESYITYYNKNNQNKNKCPNELYVACTRASEKLTVVHHCQNDFLPFLNRNNLQKYANVILKNSLRKMEKADFHVHSKFSVTDLCQHLPQDIIDTCIGHLEIETIRNKQKNIAISHKSSQKNTKESVSEITGIAIPAYFEYKMKNRMSIIDQMININFNIEDITPEQLLFMANKWCSYKSGLLFKLHQIEKYDWLSKENLELCLQRLQSFSISNKAIFEKNATLEYNNIKLIGYFDCIDNDNNIIYEFKCVSELKKEHYLQLAIYMFMNEKSKVHHNQAKYYLYNIFSDELIEIKSNKIYLEKMMDIILDYKCNQNKIIRDDVFIENAKYIIQKYNERRSAMESEVK